MTTPDPEVIDVDATTVAPTPAALTGTDALVAYAHQLDPRVSITPARQDLWAHALRDYPDDALRAGLLDYYAEPLPDGVHYRRPVEPGDVKRRAGRYLARCADPTHPDAWADRCPSCRAEVQAGERPASAMGLARPDRPAVGSRRRLAELMAGTPMKDTSS